MIRAATSDDMPMLLDMGRRFIEAAWSRVNVPYDEATCRDLLTSLMQDHVLLVSDDLRAMIGVVVHPWHFNRKVLTATELFWWADEGCKAGHALRKQAESLAAGMGARTINMACQEHMRADALTRLYRMDGYSPSERILIKDLS